MRILGALAIALSVCWGRLKISKFDLPEHCTCSYIEWTRAEWPAGGPEAGTTALLERATRSLVGVPSMAGNVEYVKLWIMYADSLSDPSDVFRYMHVQKIGADCALFYMAWAWLSEHKGRPPPC